MKRWLLNEKEEPRRAPRVEGPEVVVHYWDGSVPKGRALRDISRTGAYIYTPERWYLGTIIRIVLQGYQREMRQDGVETPLASICIPAQVVRHGIDGVGVEFAFRDKREEETFTNFLAAIPAQPQKSVESNLTARKGGQSLIEFALIIPLVFLLAVNAVNFGGFLFAWITVANAARAGAQYMSLSGSSPGAPSPATLAQVTALVTHDVSSLLNRSSVVVTVCKNATAAPNACTSLFDPEAPAYTLETVDVTYTYVPFIPLFSFPGLAIRATLPSSTIHRKGVMRVLQ